MKPIITAILLSLTAVPVMAQSVTFPTLTYPEPAPEPVVSQDIGGIDQ